jgi:osmotically inducible protein OsmC
MALKRTSTAIWQGDGLTGQGTLTTQSGAFQEQPYSFKARFEDESGRSGTNPEELIAAAHAGCFTMALAFQLKEAGYVADSLRTGATITLEKSGGGFAFQGIELALQAKIPNISREKFQELAQAAKENCPVSRALKAVPMRLHAELG